jgi:hypothetical protein
MHYIGRGLHGEGTWSLNSRLPPRLLEPSAANGGGAAARTARESTTNSSVTERRFGWLGFHALRSALCLWRNALNSHRPATGSIHHRLGLRITVEAPLWLPYLRPRVWSQRRRQRRTRDAHRVLVVPHPVRLVSTSQRISAFLFNA